jgi:hypothetical protein
MHPHTGVARRPVPGGPTSGDRRVDLDVLRRARAEFDEMPGLHLTEQQAARL